MSKADLTNWAQGHHSRLTHDLFRFPGKFHPPLAEYLIANFARQGVADPMAGVGTVAVEAKAAGIPSLSIDIDPLSTFMTRVKSTPVAGDRLASAWTPLKSSLERHRRPVIEVKKRRFVDIRSRDMRQQLEDLEAADLARLTYWFRRYVLVDYAKIEHTILNGVMQSEAVSIRNFFRACLLSTVRRISNADPSPVSGLEITQLMRDRIQSGYEIDVFQEFYRRVESRIRAADEYYRLLNDRKLLDTRTCITNSDCFRLNSIAASYDFQADLILFSPPYCNAIEYWRRHRLEYLLGGFLDDEEVSTFSHNFIGRTVTGGTAEIPPPIGFRPIDSLLKGICRDGRIHKAALIAQYFDDLKRALWISRRHLPTGGHCVLVIGDSTTGGKRIPTTQTVAWLGRQLGFDHTQTQSYRIQNRSMQYPLKPHGRIKQESILVFRKS